MIVSSPPAPSITSLAPLPTIVSFPAVPMIVTCLPPQLAAAARLASGLASSSPRTAPQSSKRIKPGRGRERELGMGSPHRTPGRWPSHLIEQTSSRASQRRSYRLRSAYARWHLRTQLLLGVLHRPAEAGAEDRDDPA